MARPRRADRPVRACQCPQANHQHGTALAYIIDRCRCDPCTTANSAYVRNRKRQILYGRWDAGFVDAQPVRDHIAKLRKAGIGPVTIADRSGVSKGAINRLIWGQPAQGVAPSKRVKAATASAIYAVRPNPGNLAPGAQINGTGTRRRLQALSCMGWSTIRLAEQLGCTHNNVSYLLNSKRAVTKATADAIAALYDRLWSAPPVARGNFEAAGVRATRSNALAKGWAPPLAWDDDAIDDPAAQPAHQLRDPDLQRGIDEAAVLRRLEGDHKVSLTRAERWVCVRRLHAARLSDGQIAVRIGYPDRTILRDRQELGLPAVVEPGRRSVA